MRTHEPNSGNPISSLKSRSKLLRFLSFFLSVLVLHLFTGCTYYRVKGIPDSQQETQITWLKKFNQAQKYIVLHQGGTSLHLRNAYLDEANLQLKGTPEILAPEHSYTHRPEVGKGYRYKKKVHSPLNEVHLYLSQDLQLTMGEQIDIPIASIQSIGYSDTNTGRSVANVTGIVVGTLALLVIIVALTKDSCPFIYVDNGEEMVFQGELYPGNIIKNAQKTDFLRLPAIREINGQYTITITNELQEVQHTDEAVLEIVDHPKDVTVMMDPDGNLYSITDPIAPTRAVADEAHELTQAVTAADEFFAGFDTPMEHSEGTRSLDVWFDHEAENSSGKLLLRLKNTFWMDFALQTFFRQMGSYYPKFQKQQQKSTLEKAYQWREDQNMPLSVYVDTGKGWQLQQQVYAVGPMLYRDLVVPLDLEAVGDAPLKIRLKTGHKFWEIDYVGMDYTPNIEITKIELAPKYAVDNYGEEVAAKLAQPDDTYYIQSEVGDRVDIQYESPAMQDESRTVFLRNKGYYIYKRDYIGRPDFEELKKFRNPGHFTEYAEEQYHALIEAFMTQKSEIVAQDEAY